MPDIGGTAMMPRRGTEHRVRPFTRPAHGPAALECRYLTAFAGQGRRRGSYRAIVSQADHHRGCRQSLPAVAAATGAGEARCCLAAVRFHRRPGAAGRSQER